MTIRPDEGRQLSSKKEWDLLSSTFSPALESLPAARLKSKILRATKLRDKYTDLYRRQKLSSRTRRTGKPGESLNARTRQKAQMFKEAIARLKPQLKKAVAAGKAATSSNQKPKVQTGKSWTRRNSQSRKDQTARPPVPKPTAKQKVFAAAAIGAGQKRIQSHVAASGRRRQVKRDSKGQ